MNKKNSFLHYICQSRDTPSENIITAIKTGIEQGVGGKRGRGGLAMKNDNGKSPLQFLSARNCISNNALFKYLIEAKPKLITKRDFKGLKLVHSAASGGNSSVTRKLLKVSPESIALEDENGCLPIHLACKCNFLKKDMLRLLLKEGVNYDVGGNGGKGGLMAEDNDGRTALYYLAKNLPYDERRWAHIKVLFEGIVNDVPLIQAAIETGSQGWKLHSLVSRYRNALSHEDYNGRLPLHLILEKESTAFGHAQRLIRDENPDAVGKLDGLTGAYPFMIAASRPEPRLGDIYELLRLNPSVIDLSSVRVFSEPTFPKKEVE